MFSLLFTLVMVDGPSLFISDTELFQVMQPGEVFVREDGEVYVLNFDESRIQQYDTSGKLKRQIGGKGKGPGEFTYPTYIRVMSDRLYVQDELTKLISVFELEGTFERHIRMPTDHSSVHRSGGGWFFWDQEREAKTSELQWTTDDFKKRSKKVDIKDLGWGAGTWAWSQGDKMKVTFSPLEVRPRLAVSPDGTRVYFADAQSARIQVFDGISGKALHTILTQKKRIPFDEEWADEEYQRRTENFRKRRPGVPIKKLYPENFPVIRQLMFEPKGQLVVDRWRGRPDDHHQLTAYDQKGKITSLKYSWEALRRIVGIANGQAYIMMFEEDEDAGIAKIPLAEAQDFVKQYPITQWQTSRSISISN